MLTILLEKRNCSSRWSRAGLKAASFRGGLYRLKKLSGCLRVNELDSMAGSYTIQFSQK